MATDRTWTRSAGRVAAVGTDLDIAGFGLAGVLLCPAPTAAAARAAWAALPEDIAVVILTEDAGAALDGVRSENGPLTVVLPP